jgi:hypothetical protein
MQIDEVYRIAFNAFHDALRTVFATEEAGVEIAGKYRGGMLVLKPQDASLVPKDIEIDVFFRKIIAVRNNLRTLEQKINASNLSEAEKLELDGYITRSYGSLTSFNVLFQDGSDRFVGQRGE